MRYNTLPVIHQGDVARIPRERFARRTATGQGGAARLRGQVSLSPYFASNATRRVYRPLLDP